jgi:hypothetical protein
MKFLLPFLFFCAFSPALSQTTLVSPPEYDTVLYNPGCGVETQWGVDGDLPYTQYPKSRVYYPRYTWAQLEHTTQVPPGSELHLRILFENEGVAPPYHPYPLLVKLEPVDSGAPVIDTLSGFDVKTWIPGAYTVQDSISIPAGQARGFYDVKLAFFYPDSDAPAIQLANYGKDSAGWYKFSTMEVGAVSIEGRDVLAARNLELKVSPNPFTGSLAVNFTLPRAGDVACTMYDLSGKIVRRLADGPRTPGRHNLHWNGRDDAGRLAASGIYWVRLRAGQASLTKKVVIP